MMKYARRAAALLVLGISIQAASAQDAALSYPSKPVQIIVPFAAGGGTDVVARLIGSELSGKWHQPVVVENRPGAGGNIGAAVVARSAPDGQTLLMATSGIMGANKALYKSLPFDPLRDFAPVALVSLVPNLIVVNPALPVADLPGLIAYAKARPGQVFYGSAGSGTSLHLSGALFCARAGIEMVHVPYKGGAQAATDPAPEPRPGPTGMCGGAAEFLIRLPGRMPRMSP